MAEALTTDPTTTTIPADTTSATPAADAGTPSVSALSAGAAPAANADEWAQAIPEKYRVTKDDGTLDPAASVPKNL